MALKPGETLGEVLPPTRPVAYDVWRKVLDANGTPTGESVRDKYLPMAQVLDSLGSYLTAHALRPAKLFVPEDREHLTWPDQPGRIACYAITAGDKQSWFVIVNLLAGGRIHDLFVGETKEGLAHAQAIANACAAALGA